MATSLKELIVTFEANARPVLNELNKINKKLKNTTKSLKSTADSFTLLGKEISLTLSLPIAAMGIASVKAVADIQSLEASLTSVLNKFDTGLPIQKAVSEEIEYLKNVTNELGISFSSSVKPYIRYLAASKDNLATNRKVMKSFLALSTGLGLTTDDIKRVIRSLEQMQSKGQIMSEELKLQLGDAIPGAVSLFAEAMNVSEAELLKLMKQGKVSSDVLSDVADVIEKKYGAAIDKGSKSIRANTNRIANAFYMLRISVGKGLDEAFQINNRMSLFADWLLKVAEGFSRLDKTGKKIILSIGVFLAVIGPFLIGLGAIARILSFAVLGFNLLLKPLILLLGVVPRLIAGFRLLSLAISANPLGAFITASTLIIVYWKQIVALFQKAFDYISKFSVSGIVNKIKDLVGLGDGTIDISSGAKNAVTNSTNQNNVVNNKKSIINNLNVNIPPNILASDADSIKNAVKQALQEENKQTYFELGTI